MKFNQSMLKTWMLCPLQAKFKYEERLPWKQNAKASFGTIIHFCMEHYAWHQDLDQALDMFKDNWQNPEKLNVTPETWPRGNTFGSLREKGIEILKTQHEQLKWVSRQVVATEHRFCVPFGDHEISGIVDLIEIRKAGNGRRTLRLADYKAQPLDSRVLTPSGWRSFGDLVVGDSVIGSDGSATKVEGVYPQGAKRVVEVEFNDGSLVRCSEEHLWTFFDRALGRVVTLPLRDLKNLKSGNNYRYSVQTCPPVTFDPQQELPLDPYLMGILIAEGGMSRRATVAVSNTSDEVIDRVRSLLPRGASLSTPHRGTYRIVGSDRVNPVLNVLRMLGLHGLKSEAKFIPAPYLTSSVADRVALLAGLMDGDGSASNRTQFRTSSTALHRDFLELCRSLGGVPMSTKNAAYYIKEGVRHNCLDAYHISPRLPFNPFSMGSKKDVWKPPAKRQTRSVSGIKVLDGDVPMQCIRVANEDGLYVTDDYVLTHNTNTVQPKLNTLRLDIQFTTYVYASLQQEFWLGFSDEYPAMTDGQKWWDEVQNLPRKGIWSHLWTGKDIDVGNREDGDFERLYRLLNEVQRAIELDIHIPSIAADSCLYCDYTDRCRFVIPARQQEALEEDDGAVNI